MGGSRLDALAGRPRRREISSRTALNAGLVPRRDCSGTGLSYRTPRRSAGLDPADRVADANRTGRDHSCERAAGPLPVHRLLKTRQCVLHPLARCRLAPDGETYIADEQHATARFKQRYAAEEQVGATGGGVEVGVKLAHQSCPTLRLEQRHLTSTTAIDAADEPAFRLELRRLHPVHRATMRAFDPDRLEMSVRHVTSPANANR